MTITTVGYGDRYPTTAVGRAAAVFVMVMGIGIIGALASILASLLVAPTEEAAPVEAPRPAGGRRGPADRTPSGPASAYSRDRRRSLSNART